MELGRNEESEQGKTSCQLENAGVVCGEANDASGAKSRSLDSGRFASCARDDKPEGVTDDGETELTEEEADKLSAFIQQDPHDEGELTAREKRLLAKRKSIEDHIATMARYGELPGPSQEVHLDAGGRTQVQAGATRGPDAVMVEDQEPERAAAKLAGERGTAGVRANRGETEYCAEGEADGDLDVGGGEILFEHDYTARHFDSAGGARPEAAEEIFRMVHRFVENLPRPEAGAEAVEVKPEAVGVSGAGQRVSRGDRG